MMKRALPNSIGSLALIFSQKPGKYLTLYNSSGPITRPLIHAAHAERERRGAIIFFFFKKIKKRDFFVFYGFVRDVVRTV
jgi:hypothetical protein